MPAYAIVPPQIDRSKPAHKQSDPTLHAGVVKERDDGIVIAGAQQLATGGVLADYIHLSCIHPLQPGDENYANCVAIPVNAPGLKLYPRRPFALRATIPSTTRCRAASTSPTATSCSTTCSCPGSTCSSIAISRSRRDQWWKTPSHLYGNHQAQVRYVTKLRFMMGLAKRMNEMTGTAASRRCRS